MRIVKVDDPAGTLRFVRYTPDGKEGSMEGSTDFEKEVVVLEAPERLELGQPTHIFQVDAKVVPFWTRAVVSTTQPASDADSAIEAVRAQVKRAFGSNAELVDVEVTLL